jgi:transcriptional regulator with XRE-family HTH domain
MKREVLIKFGKKVREERNKLDLSQEKLASRAGVHRTYIGMIERAEKNITLENIGNTSFSKHYATYHFKNIPKLKTIKDKSETNMQHVASRYYDGCS